MPATPTPGAGGAYRYDPETDRYVLLEATADDLAPAHPLAAPEPPPVAPAALFQRVVAVDDDKTNGPTPAP